MPQQPTLPNQSGVDGRMAVGPSLALLGAQVETRLDLNARFAKELLDNEGGWYGLGVTADTFPTLRVDAGAVIFPSGQVASIPGGWLEVPPTPEGVFYVLVDTDLEVKVTSVLPVSGLYVLATVVVNGAGNGFVSVDPTVVLEEFTYDPGNPDYIQAVEMRSGGIFIRKMVFTYNAEGRVQQVAVTQRAIGGVNKIIHWAYDPSGKIVERTEQSFPEARLLLDGSVLLDGTQLLDGVFSA